MREGTCDICKIFADYLKRDNPKLVVMIASTKVIYYGRNAVAEMDDLCSGKHYVVEFTRDRVFKVVEC